MSPIDVLRHHVTGAIERGEAEPITEAPAAHVVRARSTDLADAAAPEDVADILRRAADKFRESVPELQSAWQDDGAGKVWGKLANALETAARACDRATARAY